MKHTHEEEKELSYSKEKTQFLGVEVANLVEEFLARAQRKEDVGIFLHDPEKMIGFVKKSGRIKKEEKARMMAKFLNIFLTKAIKEKMEVCGTVRMAKNIIQVKVVEEPAWYEASIPRLFFRIRSVGSNTEIEI